MQVEKTLIEFIAMYWKAGGVGVSVGMGVVALKLAMNHLAHIQSSNDDIVTGVRDLITAINIHDAHEGDHHTAEMAVLTALIKK